MAFVQPVQLVGNENGNISVEFGKSTNLDRFGRLKVSDPGNRFDGEFKNGKNLELFDEVTSGAGTITFDANSRDLIIASNGNTANDSAFVYSHIDIPYTPGNSQLIDITGTLNNADLVGDVEVFLRSKITGTVVEQVVTRANWDNQETSHIDFSKSQIFVMDFQSLKVGIIGFYLNMAGQSILMHEIENDNLRKTGYWQTPDQPVRWGTYNDATYSYSEVCYGDNDNGIGFRFKTLKNASIAMRAICATVKSEGGVGISDLPAYNRTVSLQQTAKTVSTTLIPLLSIRVAATYQSLINKTITLPSSVRLTTNQPIRYVVLYRPTLTGASFAAVANSAMESDITASAVSGGIIIDEDYIAAGNRASGGDVVSLLGKVAMAIGKSGTPDILTIAAIRTDTTNASVLAALKWKEIR